MPFGKLCHGRLSQRPRVRAVIDDNLCLQPAIVVDPLCISGPQAYASMGCRLSQLVIVGNAEGSIFRLPVHYGMEQIPLLNAGAPLSVTISVKLMPAVF